LRYRNRSAAILTFTACCVGALSILAQPAEAQINNPIVSYSCSGEGVSSCANSAVSTVGGVDLIELGISGTCQSGAKPSTSQYAYTDKCSKIYNLDVIGYIENEEVEDDCGNIDTIGEVDAEASIGLVGGATVATTYSGEDCEGDEFESAPGSLVESPC
jgi:hypothetical protein